MNPPGYLLWDDGRAELLAPIVLGWRDYYSACLVCPMTGTTMVRWGWGTAGRMYVWHFHPADETAPNLEYDQSFQIMMSHMPVQVLRRIFLYFCDEASAAGVLPHIGACPAKRV